MIASFYGACSACIAAIEGRPLAITNLHPSDTWYCNLSDDEDVVVALRYCSLELNGDALGT